MLGLWRKFVVGLRIVERVNTYVGDGEYLKEELVARQELDAKMEILDQEEPKEREGKLALALEDEQVIVVESTHPPPAPPRERSAPVEIQRGKRLRRIDDTDAQDGGFLLDTPEEQFSNRDENESAGGFLQDAEKDDGGFFHEQSDGGGGFMADDNPPDMIEDGNLAVDRQDEPEPELSAPTVTGITATSSEKESHGRMSRVPSTRSANGESSNDADMESLLSHDPEDEDAEPDWLD
jgi:xeroderma pigmentosum group C-complementing protein